MIYHTIQSFIFQLVRHSSVIIVTFYANFFCIEGVFIPKPYLSFLSLVPVSGSRWRAHYKVVEFQPRAEDTRTLDSGLKVSTIYVFPIC